jgi:hypothetical protein
MAKVLVDKVFKPTLCDLTWLVRLVWERAYVGPKTVDQLEPVNNGAGESDDEVGRHRVDLLNAELLDLD